MTIQSRNKLDLKIRQGIKTQGLDAALAAGVDNFTYVTGIALPFAEQSLDRQAVALQTASGSSCVICPPDWVQAIQDQGWQGDLAAYSEHDGPHPGALIKTLADAISDLGLAESKIGLDATAASKRFVETLQQSVPTADWTPCDDLFRDLRLVKTDAEIELLETAARHADRAAISALNHLEGTVDAVSYTVKEFTERLRVHVGEFGGSAAGHIAAMQGADAQLIYTPPVGFLANGNLVRTELTNHHRGYWSSAGRTVVIGQPTEQQLDAYRDNVLLKQAAIQAFRPGARCSEVFAAVAQAAQSTGIEFWQDVGIGHGVGASEREAPYLNPDDATLLQPGMVLVLAIYTYGPRRELICSKDTFAITADGCRLLSWYKDWSRLYRVVGVTARHG